MSLGNSTVCPVSSGLTRQRIDELASGVAQPREGEVRELAHRLKLMHECYRNLAEHHNGGCFSVVTKSTKDKHGNQT
jgi:hypothetical protein